MDDWHPLLPPAIQEYEGLQRRHEAATQECKILEEERDEAIKKLDEFQQVSVRVIEEVAAIQEKLETERMCRESAEALASKLNHRNNSLKRKSVMLMSRLSPETVGEINLEDEDEEGDELNAASQDCLSTTCQDKVSELQSKLQLTLKEKDQVCDSLAMLREQLKETRQELLKEKRDYTVLMAETVQQKMMLRKYNRVSQFAVEEFEALQDSLNLERGLREGPENFARAMLVEQKMLKRRSQVPTQSSALQEALSQVTSLTTDLETLRQEHRSEIKQLEANLSRCKALKAPTAARCKLELVEEEKRECSAKCSEAQAEVKDLRFTVEELEKKLQTFTDPPRPPVPTCLPPPPPPLPPSAAFNPLRSGSQAAGSRGNDEQDQERGSASACQPETKWRGCPQILPSRNLKQSWGILTRPFLNQKSPLYHPKMTNCRKSF
ncbi:shootin-1 isoform X3 [Phycodurus eques]|uniref:shootin-1 isoform X3 n=1 Tax=Phycodurus eques TaxID=693459 RepID=UPI002ACEA5CA|nr:shootin-1 isoform X3 [Phycodurus eques]